MLSITSIITAIVGLVQSILFSLLLLVKKKKNLSDKFLLCWFLFFALHTFLIINVNEASRFHLLLVKTIGLLNGPLLLFYTRAVFNIRFTKLDFLHFLPFLIFLLCGLIIAVEWANIYEATLVVLKLAALIVYPLYVRFWLKKQYDSLKKSRADNFYLDTKWINTIALLLLFYAIIRALHFLGDFLLNIHFSGFVDILMYVTILTAIGFYGLKFKIVYDSGPSYSIIEQPTPQKKKYKSSPLKREKIIQIKRKVDTYFETSEDYLDPDFNLSQLSELLVIKKHHLSEVINLEMGTTFYDIVNAKRIQYATQRIREQSESKITFEGLGYESGFKTKSAFYHHFKNFTGKTPGQYKAQVSAD